MRSSAPTETATNLSKGWTASRAGATSVSLFPSPSSMRMQSDIWLRQGRFLGFLGSDIGPLKALIDDGLSLVWNTGPVEGPTFFYQKMHWKLCNLLWFIRSTGPRLGRVEPKLTFTPTIILAQSRIHTYVCVSFSQTTLLVPFNNGITAS